MTQFLSDKIKVMSFLAIVVVLYIHAGLPYMEHPDGMMQVAMLAREIIARIIGDCAVPLFYTISGYLFFRHVDSISGIWEKMKKRVKSLFVPFIIASIHVPLFYILIEQIPGVSNYINAEPFLSVIGKMSIGAIICSLFYDSGNTFPWAVHLWFLRDLIIIVALAPILFWSTRKIGVTALIGVFVLYLLFSKAYLLYGMIWFLMGYFFLEKLSVYKSIWFPVFWLAFAICHSFTHGFEYWHVLKLVEISLGIITFWNLYDVVVPSTFTLDNCKWLMTACGFTFFIYLYHDPEYHIIVKGIPVLVGRNGWGFLLSFVLSPLIYIPLMIAIGTVLKKYTPRVYSLLTGGR